MTRIVALGHPCAGDDGVGLAVLEALRTSELDAELCHVADTSALVLLFGDGERVVVVDALVGAGRPGEVRVLTPGELAAQTRALSSHGLSLSQALELARVIAPGNPPEVRIVAITIERPSGASVGLTPEVARAVPRAVEVVRGLVG